MKLMAHIISTPVLILGGAFLGYYFHNKISSFISYLINKIKPKI